MSVAFITGGGFGGICHALDWWGRGEIVKHLYDYGFIRLIGNPAVFVSILLGGFYLLWQQAKLPNQTIRLYGPSGAEISKDRHPLLLIAIIGSSLSVILVVGVLLVVRFLTVKSQKNVSIPPRANNTNNASQPATPSTGDICVSYDPSSLFVGQVNSAYRVKNTEMEIPISFTSSVQAHTFLYEARRHVGVCWTPTVEKNIKTGYDAYLIWQKQSSQFDFPLPQVSSQILLGASCYLYTGLRYEQDDESGPAYLRGDSGSTELDSSPNILTFNSAVEARRAFEDANTFQSAMICTLSTSDDTGGNTHPVVAFKED